MLTENEPYEIRSVLTVLSQTQKTFDEIRLLYLTFNHNPFDGINLLRDDPVTTLRLQSEYVRLERLKKTPYNGPNKIVSRGGGIYRVPAGPEPNSGKDIRIWLDKRRIQEVLDLQLPYFRNELMQASNEVQKENRTIGLQGYTKSLDDLRSQLSAFEGKTPDQFPQLVEDPTVNWREIYEQLNDLTFLVEEAAHKYTDVIKPYLKESQPYNEPNLTTSTLETSDTRTNKFNSMPLNEVRQWFSQLVDCNSKNGNPFLTVEQVEQFIERAFINKIVTEKLSMNEKQGDKGNVVGLFHLFYTHCTIHLPKIGKIDPNATTEKYTRLITDHFDNWTYYQIKNNFRSGGNWKKPT